MDTPEIARAPQPVGRGPGPKPGPAIGAAVGLVIGAVVPVVLTFILALAGKLADGEVPEPPRLLFALVLIGLCCGGAAALIGAITGWVGRLPELVGPTVGLVLVEVNVLAFLAAIGEFNPQHDVFVVLNVLGGAFGFFCGLLIGTALRVAGLLRVRATGRTLPFLGGCALISLFLGLALGEVFSHLDLH